MYCIYCGTQLPSDARFCRQCGKPQGSVDASASDRSLPEPAWENLEIEVREDGMPFMKSMALSLASGAPALKRHAFIARTIGPAGEKHEKVGQFDCFVTDEVELMQDRRSAQEQLDVLSRRLINDGWEPLTRGRWWFSYRFRRAYEPAERKRQVFEIQAQAGAITTFGTNWRYYISVAGKLIQSEKFLILKEEGYGLNIPPQNQHTDTVLREFIKSLEQQGYQIVATSGPHWFSKRVQLRE